MIQRHIVDLRDFIFVLLIKHNDEPYAEKEYKFIVKLWCAWFYMAPFMWLAIIQYKLGMNALLVTDNKYINLAIPLLLLIPYNLIFKIIFRWISIFPIDKNMNEIKYRHLRNKSIYIFLFGIVLNSIIPWALDRLMPSFVR